MKKWSSEDKWEIRKTFHEMYHLSIEVGDADKVKILSVVRKLIPHLGDLSPSDVVKKIDDAGKIAIGELPGREVRGICEKLNESGIFFEAKNVSYISYLPVNQTKNTVWLIEDQDEAEMVAKEMISEGAKVIEIQA